PPFPQLDRPRRASAAPGPPPSVAYRARPSGLFGSVRRPDAAVKRARRGGQDRLPAACYTRPAATPGAPWRQHASAEKEKTMQQTSAAQQAVLDAQRRRIDAMVKGDAA